MRVSSSISSSRPLRSETGTSSGVFIAGFLLPILLVLPVGVANYLFLLNAGELTSIEDIIDVQLRRGGLYGTAIYDNDYAYKLALYGKEKPDIAVIGSSRVLEIRGRYFSTSFVNLGRTVNGPKEAERLIEDMLAIAKPKLVIFGIDYWWFAKGFIGPLSYASHLIQGGELTADGLIAPSKWLFEGRFSPRFFWQTIRNGRPVRVGGFPMFGVNAIKRGAGFAVDGSRYFLGMIYGKRPADDGRFQDTLGRISNNRGQFRRAEGVDEAQVASLKRVLRRLESEGIPVITFLPPLAPSVLAAMGKYSRGYQYINEVRHQIASISKHNYDFYDPRRLGITDCEFIDGMHPGDVAAARMVERMAEDTTSGLARYVDWRTLKTVVREYSGMALADNRFRLPGEREVDFLRIGCAKS